MRRNIPIFSNDKIRPRITEADILGKSFGPRYALIIIRWAAKRRYKIKIKYRRIQDGTIRSYVVEPYSLRYRRTRDGVRKMLFAYHGMHRRIHGFAVKNIMQVNVIDKSYSPKWKVELK